MLDLKTARNMTKAKNDSAFLREQKPQNRKIFSFFIFALRASARAGS